MFAEVSELVSRAEMVKYCHFWICVLNDYHYIYMFDFIFPQSAAVPTETCCC